MSDTEFMIPRDDELYHHGVKGQKWGILRYQNKDSSLLKSGKKHSTKISNFLSKHKEKTVAKKALKAPTSKEISKLTDDELKKRIDRMDLEIKYKSKYSELHPAKISAGKKFLKSMTGVTTSSLEKAGKNIGGQLATYLAGELTNKIAGKEVVNPKKGQTYFFTYEETLLHKKRSYWQMPCSLGADLSQGDDFCAFTFLFPLGGGKFGVKTRNYISEVTLRKLPAAMRVKYDMFIQEDSLKVMPGTVLNMMEVYDDLDAFIADHEYDVECFGYDPYNAKEFVERWGTENGSFGIEKVIQGARTESVPLGELKKLAEERILYFDEELMKFAMGNCIIIEDTNGNRKLSKKRYDQKIDAVAAMMDAYVAYKLNIDAFE